MIWVSWPKKLSRVATDLNENVIRGPDLKSGLVDTEVCMIDKIWSGLKLVIRRNKLSAQNENDKSTNGRTARNPLCGGNS